MAKQAKGEAAMVMQQPLTQGDVEAYRLFLYEKLGIDIKPKETSRLMRFFAVFVQLFNKEFMNRYITTIGKTVYWPRIGRLGKNPSHDVSVMFHESQHAWDFKHHPIRMWVGYGLPQWFVLLSSLSLLTICCSNWWALCVLFVAMIAPLPAPGRRWAEERGYSCTMAFRIWTGGEVNGSYFEYIAKQFTGSHYYYMWPFPKNMNRRLVAIEQRIRRGKMTEVQRMTYEFLQHRGILAA